MSGMRTMDFDAVAASAPLDATAAAVRDGSGDVWEAKSATGALHFKAPPKPRGSMPSNMANLTGHVFDRITVIRFHEMTGAGRAMWLVRCVCGDYEIRRAESLRKSEGKPACCGLCLRLDLLRARTARPVKSRDRTASAAMLDGLSQGASR